MIFINSIKCPELILRGCSSPDKIQLICEPFNIHDIVVCRIKNEKQKITSDKHKRRRYHALGNGDPRLAAVAKCVQEGGGFPVARPFCPVKAKENTACW